MPEKRKRAQIVSGSINQSKGKLPRPAIEQVPPDGTPAAKREGSPPPINGDASRTMGLSRRAYAAHRKKRGLPGGTDTAVRKAISAGRITAAVLSDGTIDQKKADKLWAETTDKSQQRSAASQSKAVAAAKETIAADEKREITAEEMDAVIEGAAEADLIDLADLDDDEGTGHSVTFAKANAADKAYSAKIKRLRYEQLSGSLIDKRAVLAHVFDLARKERDAWLQMPARKAANMAAELDVDAHLMEQVLDRYIREHLAEMAEIKFEPATG